MVSGGPPAGAAWPPVIGHDIVSGGDWRAAAWGIVSILIAMAVSYPFDRAAERRQRDAALRSEDGTDV